MRVICLRGAAWRLFPCQLFDRVPNSAGYGYVYAGCLNASGNAKTIGVHRQALEKRLGRPLRADYEACHHCGVKLCYRQEHLYEGTRKDNMRNAVEVGNCGRISALTLAEESLIQALYYSEDFSQTELAERFGVSQRTISNITRGVPTRFR